MIDPWGDNYDPNSEEVSKSDFEVKSNKPQGKNESIVEVPANDDQSMVAGEN
jgi:hypothetical protein